MSFWQVYLTIAFFLIFQKKLQWSATVPRVSEVRDQHLICHHMHGPEECGEGGRCRQGSLVKKPARLQVQGRKWLARLRVSSCIPVVKLRERENRSGRFEVPSLWHSWRYVAENKGCLSWVLLPVLAFCIKYAFLRATQFLFPALSLQFHSPPALCMQHATIIFITGPDSFSVPSPSQSQPGFWSMLAKGDLPVLFPGWAKAKLELRQCLLLF